MNKKVFMTVEDLKIIAKGFLGSMTFGAYHIYTTTHMINETNRNNQMRIDELNKNNEIRINELNKNNEMRINELMKKIENRRFF